MQRIHETKAPAPPCGGRWRTLYVQGVTESIFGRRRGFIRVGRVCSRGHAEFDYEKLERIELSAKAGWANQNRRRVSG